jgi:hypothetical protein
MNQNPMQGLASLIAAQGRGPDSTLVHMTPDEVRNLQALARARGMELPINPQTGLPEAGILDTLIKILTPVGKAISTVGRAAIQNPQLTGLVAGTAYGAIKGDLQKGLEAGMKAYAGAALIGGIPSVARGLDKQAAEKYAKSIGMEGDKETIDNFLRNIPERTAATIPQTVTQMPGATGQGGGTQQGGIFGMQQNPLAQAIALYAIDRAERKAQAKNAPVSAPQTYIPATFSRGQVNPRFGEPGQPYFIGGGYTVGQPTTQFPDYTRPTIPAQTQAPPGQPPPGQPPPSPQRNEPLDFYRAPPTQPGYSMAGGGIVPRPNPAYPMSRVPGNGYEPSIDAYTGEEKFADGGVTDTEEERRRKYFENLRPFAPALTDWYRGLPATENTADQGDTFLREIDPLTGLTQPAPRAVKTGIASLQPYDESLAEWYRSLLNPPIGRAPVDIGDYYSTTPYRAQPQFGEIPTFPDITAPPPTAPPRTPPPLPSCGPGFVYNPETLQCEPVPYPTPTPIPPTPEPSLPPETPFPPTPEPSLPPETPRPTPIPPTPEPSLPPETPRPTPIPPVTCQDIGYPPGWDYGPSGECEPPPETPRPTPIPPTPEPSLPPETPRPTPIPPTPEPSLPPETPRPTPIPPTPEPSLPPETPIPPTPEPSLPPETPKPPITCQDRNYPPGWDYDENGECQPPTPPPTPIPPTPEPTRPPETPKPPITCQDRNYPPGWDYDENGECQPPTPPPTPIPPTPEPSEPPETREPRNTPLPPIYTPEPSLPPQTTPPSGSEPPEDPNKDPDTGECFSGFYRGPFGICLPYPRQGPCPPGMFYDLLRGCVKSWDPDWGNPLPGIPGSSLPPVYPKGSCPAGMMNNPYTGEGCIPDDTDITAVPVNSPEDCPEGYYAQPHVIQYGSEKGITKYYCFKPGDMVSEREQLKRQECINAGLDYDPTTFQCKPKSTGVQPPTGGYPPPPGTGYTPPTPGGGTVTVGTKICYTSADGGGYLYVGEDEECPQGYGQVGGGGAGGKGGTDASDGGAAGGYVKKGKIKKKKYQAGGIASLTRDSRLGGAVNPIDGYNFGFAGGGMAAMPEYQAGGKLLRGAGDGMSDDIPAVIRGKGVQRAALADGEFVIPADVVSHLGNGSTEAGAKKLYKMMAQIRAARTGKTKQAPRVNTDKYLPRA